jgi:hypothetical protein
MQARSNASFPIEIILSISSKTLPEAKKIIADFHVSETYQALISKTFDAMSDDEAIMFALTRRAEETKKLTSLRLLQAMDARATILDEASLHHLKALLMALIYMEPACDEENDNDLSDDVGFNYLKKDPKKAFDKLYGDYLYQPTHHRLCIFEHHYLNFSGLDFKGVKLGSANLQDMDWSGANLEEANLDSAIFHRAYLANTNLTKASLIEADLAQCHWEEATLSDAKLTDRFHVTHFLDHITDVDGLNQQLDSLQDKLQHHLSLRETLVTAIAQQLARMIEKKDQQDLSDTSIQGKLALVHAAISHSIFKDAKASDYTVTNLMNSMFIFFQSTPFFRTTKALSILCELSDTLKCEAALSFEERIAKKHQAEQAFHAFFRSGAKPSPNEKPKEEGQRAKQEAELQVFIKQHVSCYALLGIAPNANNNEIKKAFNRLAKANHPDKNHAMDAGEKFNALVFAKATLQDPLRRREHDQYLALHSDAKLAFMSL